MKTKNILSLASVVMLSLVMTACGDPEQKFEITVADKNGKPMADIECRAGFNLGKKNGPGISPYTVSGTTDAKGKVEISGETVFFNTSIRVRKNGYYDSVIEKLWMTGKSETGSRWEPWPVEVNLVIKKSEIRSRCMQSDVAPPRFFSSRKKTWSFRI